MPDVARRPERVEKLHTDPTEKAALQKKIADAPPPSSKAAPETKSDDQVIKRALQPREVSQKAELEAKIGRTPSADKTAAKFQHDMGDLPGAEGVHSTWEHSNPNDQKGARFQMEVANGLGKSKIRGFEECIRPSSLEGKHNLIDIATKDHTAIECKAYEQTKTQPCHLRTWAEKAEVQLETDPDTGKPFYKKVIIVISDGSMTDEARNEAQLLMRANPKLKICEHSELKKHVS